MDKASRRFQLNLNIAQMPPHTTKIVFWQDKDGSWDVSANWKTTPEIDAACSELAALLTRHGSPRS